jgi:hypothetical protein
MKKEEIRKEYFKYLSESLDFAIMILNSGE